MKVKVLKIELEKRGLDTTGNKDVLQERLAETQQQVPIDDELLQQLCVLCVLLKSLRCRTHQL